jgi:hypothetical protein
MMTYDRFANAYVEHCQLEKNMAMLLLNNFAQVIHKIIKD